MAAGYIYVLVNSSMPGLVKVGKTSRLPTERARELSNATGVAIPFIVAFEEFCSDCDAAEQIIHTELDHLGFRPSQNREFFRASTNDIIRIVLRISSEFKASEDDSVVPELDDFAEPWEGLMAEANALQYGRGDSIQDIEEAIELYEMAARMGSSEACLCLGDIYLIGFHIREDTRLALNWFKEGAKLGGFENHICMAKVYCEDGHRENALKCLRNFFTGIEEWREQNPQKDYEIEFERLLEQYIHCCLDNDLPIEFSKFIRRSAITILERVVPRLSDNLSFDEKTELTRVRDILLNAVPDVRDSFLLKQASFTGKKPSFFSRFKI